MTRKRKIQIIIDVLMLAALPVMMAYSLAGDALHEWLGIAMFLLFVLHHILNRQLIKNLFRGKYTPARTVNTLLNLLLVFVMFALPISGILMANHLPVDIHISGVTFGARMVHMLAAFWGFLLMSIHFGMHWNQMMRIFQNKLPKSVVCKWLIRIVVICIAGYGIRAFYVRKLSDYLFLRSHFVFYNFEEPIAFFLLDYIAIIGLFAMIGYYVCILLLKWNSLKRLDNR